jgi:short subunit dehydrogenase-like uncharacterized protein
MSLGKGLRRWFTAHGITLGIGAFVGLSLMGWTRSLLLATVLPDPGEGPSPEDQAKGFFRIRLVGKSSAERLTVVVRGKRDPGYGATSRMLTESALCLALDRDSLPERFGVLTPASAMGEALITRLVKAEVTFELDESNS